MWSWIIFALIRLASYPLPTSLAKGTEPVLNNFYTADLPLPSAASPLKPTHGPSLSSLNQLLLESTSTLFGDFRI